MQRTKERLARHIRKDVQLLAEGRPAAKCQESSDNVIHAIGQLVIGETSHEILGIKKQAHPLPL